MQPRLLTRTHYQVDEPAYMGLLCRLCASGSRSAYKEVIAAKFAEQMGSRGKRFNEPAAGYAVDVARALDLLTPQNVLSAKGQMLCLLAPAR